MKKLLFSVMFLSLALVVQAQANKADILQDLEKNQPANQDVTGTATLKSSSRLFKTMDDLTSVITIIPSGSSVTVLGADSTYLHVVFEENEGYIFKRHAVLDKTPANTQQTTVPQQQVQEELQAQQKETGQDQQESRFTFLENKYGSNMAAKLSAGKIWKGMNSEMVKDSWGTPGKINRAISGNLVKEEWIFKSTWLFFENNTLVDWGPIQK